MNARIAFAALALLAAPCLAGEEEGATPEEQVAAINAVAPSVVFVEYELKFDKGEARGGDSYRHSAERLIADERPLEVDGFLLEPATVMTPDMMIHPRFIKAVKVRFGEQRVEAQPSGYVVDYGAVLLRLSKPLEGTKPLVFDANLEAPYLQVCYDIRDEGWRASVSPLSENVTITETGHSFIPNVWYSAITDRKGTPVGLSMRRRLPLDSSWKGSPLKWAAMSAEEMARLLADLQGRADRALLRVKLNLRSPKAEGPTRYFQSPESEEGATERNIAGVVIDPHRILVLSYLKPKATARLERITVYPPEGEPLSARFLHTLKDYGCFVATVEEPLPGPVEVCPDRIVDLHTKLVLAAEIRVQGDQRVAYFAHKRIVSYELGWQRGVYPKLHGEEEDLFLFDLKGRLLALPVARREKPGMEERWSRHETLLTPAVFLQEALQNLPEHIDPSNVPLSDEEENRMAWIGVELQALNKELARASNVSDLTRDGETGALVSYVYPGSPAAAAGIEPGCVLLRLHIEGQPKPLEVELEEYFFDRLAFPWDRMDEWPEEAYDRIPTPWPPVENPLIRSLTDSGFGRKYTAEFFVGGQTVAKEFVAVESPPHYGSAPRYKADGLGMTVRNLTYEVRRYFQKKPDDPGVVVSKIEPGGKASVAGIKPYEIVTHINDKPVMDVKDFERVTKGQNELSLSVKRMTRGRVVPIKVVPPEKKEEEEKAGNTQP